MSFRLRAIRARLSRKGIRRGHDGFDLYWMQFSFRTSTVSRVPKPFPTSMRHESTRLVAIDVYDTIRQFEELLVQRLTKVDCKRSTKVECGQGFAPSVIFKLILGDI